MKKTFLLAFTFLATTSAAIGQSLNLPFLCNPKDGVSTCMTDVRVADDVTMAVLTGATDEYIEEAARWLRGIKVDDERGWNQVSKRVSALAMRSALDVDPRRIAVLRRHEIRNIKTFLVPVARIVTTPVGMGKPAMELRAVESDSRIVYSDTFADVCTTTNNRRYCIRVTGLNRARTVTKIWEPHQNQLLSNFRNATPNPFSEEWNKFTLLGIEVDLNKEPPRAIDGARYVTGKAKRVVLFNNSFIAGLNL